MKHVLRIAVMATSLVAAAAQAAWVDVGLMSDSTTFNRVDSSCDHRIIGFSGTTAQANIYPTSFNRSTIGRYHFIVATNPSALRYILTPHSNITTPLYAFNKIKEVADYLNNAEFETARLRDMNLFFIIQQGGTYGYNYNKIYINSGVYKESASNTSTHIMNFELPVELMSQYKLQQSC